MKGKFKCDFCNVIFEAEGIKEEWIDPIYGPCFKYVATCLKCKKEVTEYRPPKEQGAAHHESHGSACGCCSKANSCNMAED